MIGLFLFKATSKKIKKKAFESKSGGFGRPFRFGLVWLRILRLVPDGASSSFLKVLLGMRNHNSRNGIYEIKTNKIIKSKP